MKQRLAFSGLAVMFLSLALAPAAWALNTWYYVDGVNGNDSNDCMSPQTACQTIGHAIVLAHWNDFIVVAPAFYKEHLTIRKNLRIEGSDAATTILDGGYSGTVITVSNSKASVSLSKLTIQNGRAQYGGGVNNAGTLNIGDSTITANYAYAWDYDVNVASGAGIFNSGSLWIRNSTISGNTSNAHGSQTANGGWKDAFAYGGAIDNEGMLKVSNTSIVENSAFTERRGAASGGGVLNGGTMAINNSTISLNSADCDIGRVNGGGIHNTGTLTIDNSTIDNNFTHTRAYQNHGGGISNTGALMINNTTINGNYTHGFGGGHLQPRLADHQQRHHQWEFRLHARSDWWDHRHGNHPEHHRRQELRRKLRPHLNLKRL